MFCNHIGKLLRSEFAAKFLNSEDIAMKRMHIHVGVENIEIGVKFYSALFGAGPDKHNPDYAKWMLEDPRVNFAISTRTAHGVDHLGLQVDGENELAELRSRMEKADMSRFDEGETVCCYANSDKTWVRDPSGVAWEAFLTMGDVELYNADSDPVGDACCTPDGEDSAACCVPS